MPRGIPTIGSRFSVREDLASTPQAEVLGTLKPDIADPAPQGTSSAWATEGGPAVDLTEPPPPWEQEDSEYQASDARRFVDVPDSWDLRWINPKLLESSGWRYWQPVMASDPRVTLKVQSMVGPDNNIRRGGHVGDILAWMPRSWVESRRRMRQRATDALTESAVRRQETLKDEFRRGTYGPHVHLEEARHPTHTIGEGRSMKD